MKPRRRKTGAGSIRSGKNETVSGPAPALPPPEKPRHALTPGQAKRLRGLAHGLPPAVWIGRRGLTAAVLAEMEEALLAHELVKVRLRDQPDRRERSRLLEELAARTASCLAGALGHTAVFFRPHPDPARRRIDPKAGSRPPRDPKRGS